MIIYSRMFAEVCLSAYVIESVVVDFLCIVTPIVGVCNCSMICCTLLYVHSSFAIILMGKREMVALLGLSSWCHVMVVWLFLTVPWVCLRFLIVVFPDHIHLLFLMSVFFSRTLFIFTLTISNHDNCHSVLKSN